MAWNTILVGNTADGLVGFCGNVYVDNPAVDMSVSGGSANPSLAEFNGAMVLGSDAINMFDIPAGTTRRINITSDYYIQCTRGSGYNQNNRSYESNMPDFNGVLVNSSVQNRQYFSISYDDENKVALIGLFRWAYPTNYSSQYVHLGNPSNNIYNIVKNLLPPKDPYADGGYSETMEGSTGDFDDTSDTIAEPTAPALSAVDSGLITLYGVDRTNIRAFASYLFGSSFDPANFHKLFESPMEAILCLNYMPYTPSSAAATATEISFGAAGTGANGRVIGDQYETIDCGTLDLKEFYGSCLDYSPYTTVTLVLPYASAVDIDPDEFNTKTISIKYRIDNYTGAGLVLISDGTSVLMQIPCTVANPLPISASNYSSIVSSIANTAIVSAGAILAVATGGVGTGAAIALAGGVAASTAGNVMSAKLHYNHGGAGGMGTGMFGVQKPYLIIKRPRQCLPDGNNSFQGYPTFCTKNLGNVSGFTKVFQIHLDSIPATDAEKKELETILKGGVWF